jgi:amino acid transporter
LIAYGKPELFLTASQKVGKVTATLPLSRGYGSLDRTDYPRGNHGSAPVRVRITRFRSRKEKEMNSNAIVIGVGALLALVISLPLEWMTIHNAQIQFDDGFEELEEMMSPSFGQMTVKVTGINGRITFLVELPIWLIVVVGLIGVILALLNSLGVASLPKLASLIPISLSSLYVIVALILTIASSEASLGVGIFVALVGLGLGYTLVFTGRVGPKEVSHDG